MERILVRGGLFTINRENVLSFTFFIAIRHMLTHAHRLRKLTKHCTKCRVQLLCKVVFLVNFTDLMNQEKLISFLSCAVETSWTNRCGCEVGTVKCDTINICSSLTLHLFKLLVVHCLSLPSLSLFASFH